MQSGNLTDCPHSLTGLMVATFTLMSNEDSSSGMRISCKTSTTLDYLHGLRLGDTEHQIHSYIHSCTSLGSGETSGDWDDVCHFFSIERFVTTCVIKATSNSRTRAAAATPMTVLFVHAVPHSLASEEKEKGHVWNQKQQVAFVKCNIVFRQLCSSASVTTPSCTLVLTCGTHGMERTEGLTFSSATVDNRRDVLEA